VKSACPYVRKAVLCPVAFPVLCHFRSKPGFHEPPVEPLFRPMHDVATITGPEPVIGFAVGA